MIALPRVSEVISALAEFEVRPVELPGVVESPRGPTRIVCLERLTDEGLRLSQALPEEDHMPWSTFNSICWQLGIDPSKVKLRTPRPPTWWSAAEEQLPPS